MSKVLKVIAEYDFTKEDWDTILQIGQFKGETNRVDCIPSKVCTRWSLILVQESFVDGKS